MNPCPDFPSSHNLHLKMSLALSKCPYLASDSLTSQLSPKLSRVECCCHLVVKCIPAILYIVFAKTERFDTAYAHNDGIRGFRLPAQSAMRHR